MIIDPPDWLPLLTAPASSSAAAAPAAGRAPRAGLLFAYDWDAIAFRALERAGWVRWDTAGFDLFRFPSNARLAGFDLREFAQAQARRGRAAGWQAVLSHHEQFGALAAALVAEQLGLPGPGAEAILAAQHKAHARAVLDRVAPEANLRWQLLDAAYGEDIPREGIAYPSYVKPIKAAFSVLARHVADRDALQQHTRFSRWERWVIEHLVEPFEQVRRERLPQAPSAHRMLLEEPVPASARQYNLDGWVDAAGVHALGVVDAIYYPGTQAFMRWEYPSRLDAAVQARILDVARRFLQAIGFQRGLFNLEFFHDASSDRLTVIECNPRMASQFSDLYQRVDGRNPHALSLALALGEDGTTALERHRSEATAGVAASQVFRSFAGARPPRMPSRTQRLAFRARHPDALLFEMPKYGGGLARDYKWLGSHRYAVMHLGGRDWADLQARTEAASALLGWPAPYDDAAPERALRYPGRGSGRRPG